MIAKHTCFARAKLFALSGKRDLRVTFRSRACQLSFGPRFAVRPHSGFGTVPFFIRLPEVPSRTPTKHSDRPERTPIHPSKTSSTHLSARARACLTARTLARTPRSQFFNLPAASPSPPLARSPQCDPRLSSPTDSGLLNSPPSRSVQAPVSSVSFAREPGRTTGPTCPLDSFNR